MAHIVVKPRHASFKPMHRDPRTWEIWTRETAEDYQRKCKGTPRGGGVLCDIWECECTDSNPRL